MKDTKIQVSMTVAEAEALLLVLFRHTHEATATDAQRRTYWGGVIELNKAFQETQKNAGA